MKKVILSAVALAMGSFVMAQTNTSTVTQSGTANNANVSQTGELNKSTVINTNGIENTLKVTQIGKKNESAFETTDGSNMNKDAVIYQNGEENISGTLITGNANLVEVDQRGIKNNSAITVVGSNNTSDVDQRGNENKSVIDQIEGASGNSAKVYQGNNSFDQKSTITQSVSGTTIAIDNVAIVRQIGSARNTSTISQLGSIGANANVHQDGTGNNSSVKQWTGPNAGNITMVRQIGSDHKSQVQQIFGSPNLAEIRQTGTGGHVSFAKQQSTKNGTILVNQSGDNASHDSKVTQQNQPGTNYAKVTQSGSGNDSDILQLRSVNGSSTVTQTGINGKSDIDQTDSENSTATVTQSGLGQISEIIQSGNGDIATVKQSGAVGGNNSFIQQNTNAISTATVTQNGDLNDSDIMQNGTGGNTAIVNQNGSSHMSLIGQTGTGAGAHYAKVTQTGLNQMSTIMQTGVGNMATVTQN